MVSTSNSGFAGGTAAGSWCVSAISSGVMKSVRVVAVVDVVAGCNVVVVAVVGEEECRIGMDGVPATDIARRLMSCLCWKAILIALDYKI